jgi:superfamily II DNA or RNA helicase
VILSKIPLYAHQEKALERCKDAEYFGLFMEQGTGKTCVTLANTEYLFQCQKINALIVLAPSGVQINWARTEIPKFLPSYPQKTNVVLWNTYATTRQTAGMWYAIANCPTDALLIICANIEALRLSRFRDVLGIVLHNRKAMTIVDESTIIKSHDAQQSKLAMGVGEGSAYRRILTGTPVTQGPLDLFGQLRFLSKTAVPWASYTAFKAKFAVERLVRTSGGRMFPEITGYRDLDILSAAIAPFTYRVTKAECLDLPEKIYATRPIELTPEQRRMYRELVRSAFTTMPDGVVSSTLAITTMLRLHQIVLGHVTTDDQRTVSVASNRPSALRQLLGQLEGKAIIFCRFRQDIADCAGLFNDPGAYALYHGGLGPDEREFHLQRFRANPECRWLLATRPASRGLTLTEAQTIIYYSQGYSLEDRLQSEDRIHRIGQTRKCSYIELVSPGTVEDRILTALKNKQELANQVLTKSQLYDLVKLDDEIGDVSYDFCPPPPGNRQPEAPVGHCPGGDRRSGQERAEG